MIRWTSRLFRHPPNYRHAHLITASAHDLRWAAGQRMLGVPVDLLSEEQPT
ncbi:MAG TPA: hypothetical protein VFE65_06600 [Pseudonocardia sp.]|nr:hypothetical protein [Pseudonocardia sp.]